MTAARASGVDHAGTARARAADDAASRLPALGRKGGGWVAIQVALLAAAVAAGLAGAAWSAAASPWLAAAGVITALAGAALMVGGGAGLGRQLTFRGRSPAGISAAPASTGWSGIRCTAALCS